MAVIGWIKGLAACALALCGLAQAVQAVPAGVQHSCFEASARRYGLDARLLRAIARVESGMRPQAMNRDHRSQTGTVDIGLLQINSGWLPTLAKYGISETDLRHDCTNIEVGAWILAGVVAKNGNHWAAVGAYNAACTKLKGDACTAQRAKYAWKVYRSLDAPKAVAGDDMARGERNREMKRESDVRPRPIPAASAAPEPVMQLVTLGAPRS